MYVLFLKQWALLQLLNWWGLGFFCLFFVF